MDGMYWIKEPRTPVTKMAPIYYLEYQKKKVYELVDSIFLIQIVTCYHMLSMSVDTSSLFFRCFSIFLRVSLSEI